MNAVDSLIDIGRRLVAGGFSPGTSGNVSILEGEDVLISGTGTSLGDLEARSISRVAVDGRHLDGIAPSKEVPLHLGGYAKDSSCRAIIHVHSPAALALACCEPWADNSAIPPLTPYFVMKVGQTPLLPYRHPGDPALGTDLRECPYQCRAVLLSNHGAVVMGATLEDAYDRLVELESACQTALQTAGLVRRVLSTDLVRQLASAWDSPWD